MSPDGLPHSWKPLEIPPEEKKKPLVQWEPFTKPRERQAEETSFELYRDLDSQFIEVIKELPQGIPDSFRSGTLHAAFFLQCLEQGKPFITEEKKDLSEEGHRFLKEIYYAFIGPAKALSTLKTIELPPWLDRIPTPNKSLQIGSPEAAQAEKVITSLSDRLVQKLGGEKKQSTQKDSHGQSYFFLRKNELVPGNTMKLYIEGASQNDSSILDQLFVEAIDNDLHPDSMKFLENSTVLYWNNTSPETVNAFDALCKKMNIATRGPASDTIIVRGINDKNLDYETISNDSAGTRISSGFEWREKNYDSRKFFKQWLRFCFAFGKQPNNPFATSFVWSTASPSDQIKTAYHGSKSLVFIEKDQKPVWETDIFSPKNQKCIKEIYNPVSN